MKNYIALCRLYNNEGKTIWLYNCNDFYDAVEKSRYLPRSQKELPVISEETKNLPKHLLSAAMLKYTNDCYKVQWENAEMIKEVFEVREWMSPNN